MKPAADAEPGADSTSESAFAGRYQLLKELGGGGMATVYEVVDPQRGRVAFKRSRRPADPEQARRLYELFAREFHTLSQLAHPRIVQVYDYGLDDGVPYYTMELLDGGDLQQSVPSDHLRVCAAARDICSALSLLHSRRMVHRDISPRNVRCTADGTAKLIDFGAMTMMGPAKELVGTPVYCAPEMLNRQQLDARTDLYALGATLYYVLTGHHAYPVRDFGQLSSAWSFGFPRPSELLPSIPAALDALVLDLLQLDPNDRPRSAAEVMERLAVIEGKPLDESLLVAQSYLASPAFAGREGELEQLRERMPHRRGSAVLIHGPAGVGRTRLLDAGLLAGKLAGVTPLRADADDADGEYGVAGALLAQLVRVAPEATRELAGEDLPVLAGVEPALSAGGASPPPAAQACAAALRRLILAFAKRTPLLIGVDDFARIDQPSAALLALLAHDARKAPVSIFVTLESTAWKDAGSAQRMFSEAATQIALENLSYEATRSILASVFGESPELDSLVRRLFAIAHGSPRDLMRLSQHLVDNGVVRYKAGAWLLPARFELADLPASVGDMLGERTRGLSVSARSLARSLALIPEQSLDFDEIALLADVPEPSQLLRDLEQLGHADILRSAGDRRRLGDRAWVAILLAELSDAELKAKHLRLSQLFERRDEGFRAALHLLRAGERERALDRFVSHAVASQVATDRSPDEFYRLLRSLPADWQQVYEEVLQECLALGRSKRDIFALRGRLMGLVAMAGLHVTSHAAAFIEEAHAACGLRDFAELDAALPAAERVKAALGRAQARWAATPEQERVLDPGTALRVLTRSVSDSVAIAATHIDIAMVRALPSLEPFAALSPMVAVIQQLADGARARLSGRLLRAREIYMAVLERSKQADGAGLAETHRRAVQMRVGHALALIEATLGLASCLEAAQALDESHFGADALIVRMLYELWQGNPLEADRHRRKVDVLRLEANASQATEYTHLLWQVAAFAAMEDLTRLKRLIEELERVPSDSAGWQHVSAYARAEYQRVRGDLTAAELELCAQLAEIGAGDHQLWPQAAGARVQVLSDLGRVDEAVALGRRYLESAEAVQLGLCDACIRLPLAVAEARLGLSVAAARAEQVIREYLEHEVTGLNLGLAYEARARVALEQGDQAGYDQYSELCSEIYLRAANPALSARYQRLRRAAQQKALVTLPPRADTQADSPAAGTRIRDRLVGLADRTQRAQAALSMLSEQTGARDGFLYHVTTEGPVLVAAVGKRAKPPESLDTMVRNYIAGESGQVGSTTGDTTTHTTHRSDWSAIGDEFYRPVLLSHYVDAGFAITGLAVFAVGPGEQFAYPRDAAIQLSQLAAEMGDVTSLVVNEG